MILYHGSRTANITILEPKLADHGKPYVYLTTLQIVAGFYLINAVERPYYWFPYGFEPDGTVHYQEWYPHALKEAAWGKSGCIYTVESQASVFHPLDNIPCARLSTEPLAVKDCLQIENCYSWLMEQEKQGAFALKRFEEKTKEQLDFMCESLVEELFRKNMIASPNCAYAKFVRDKFPAAWDAYRKIAG